MKNVLIRYGIISSLIVCVLMLFSFPIMKNPENYSLAEIFGFTSILLSLSTIFIAVKTYRDKYNNGKIKFGKAFLIGLYITLIAGTMYALTFTVYNSLSGDPFGSFYRDYSISEIEKLNLEPLQKQAKIADLDKNIAMFSNPLVMFLVGLFVEYTPMGLIVSLISAAVMRRK